MGGLLVWASCSSAWDRDCESQAGPRVTLKEPRSPQSLLWTPGPSLGEQTLLHRPGAGMGGQKRHPPWEPCAAPGPEALTEKVVLVTSILLCEMPPLRLPGMPPLCCFFWLLTMVSMEWLRTRMALCREKRQGPDRWRSAHQMPLSSQGFFRYSPSLGHAWARSGHTGPCAHLGPPKSKGHVGKQ